MVSHHGGSTFTNGNKSSILWRFIYAMEMNHLKTCNYRRYLYGCRNTSEDLTELELNHLIGSLFTREMINSNEDQKNKKKKKRFYSHGLTGWWWWRFQQWELCIPLQKVQKDSSKKGERMLSVEFHLGSTRHKWNWKWLRTENDSGEGKESLPKFMALQVEVSMNFIKIAPFL